MTAVTPETGTTARNARVATWVLSMAVVAWFGAFMLFDLGHTSLMVSVGVALIVARVAVVVTWRN